jgi:2-amino-4-hydroxy-6-hydroxymethyldihydropteridine diphosphokinase
MTIDVYLSLGSNIEPRADYLDKARLAISQNIGTISKASNIYQTAPWHCVNPQADYLNQVLCIRSKYPPQTILTQCLAIEKTLGRDRSHQAEGYQARTIDIDLLLAQDIIVNSPELILPHPRLHLRRFVLVPMADIAPNLSVVSLNKTIGQLLADCPDQNDVHQKTC